MAKATKPTIRNKVYNNIQIVGENVLYNNGVITAFYFLPLSNYTTNNTEGVLNTIQKIKNLIESLINQVNPKLQFTIERTDKVLRAKDVISNMYDTIKIYRPDYEMPYEFTRNIRDDVQSYCILGIDIQQSTLTDAEDQTIKDTAKSLFKGVVNKVAGLGNIRMDPELILKIEESIYRSIRDRCMRCTKELVFYNYVSKLFPCYEISYDKLSYVNENNFSEIMSELHQTVSDNFGWFEMHNEGMEMFSQEPIDTYGCILTIREFPEEIDASAFPMDFANVVTTVQCLTKEEASAKIRRIKSTDEYEVNEGLNAGAAMEEVLDTHKNVQLAGIALRDIKNGQIVCKFETTILVYAETREELKQNIMAVINRCKSRDILATKTLHQATDFLDHYVDKKPGEFSHLAPLEFPLCFQQNAGATVGDTEESSIDQKGRLWWSPSIGHDIL